MKSPRGLFSMRLAALILLLPFALSAPFTGCAKGPPPPLPLGFLMEPSTYRRFPSVDLVVTNPSPREIWFSYRVVSKDGRVHKTDRRRVLEHADLTLTDMMVPGDSITLTSDNYQPLNLTVPTDNDDINRGLITQINQHWTEILKLQWEDPSIKKSRLTDLLDMLKRDPDLDKSPSTRGKITTLERILAP